MAATPVAGVRSRADEGSAGDEPDMERAAGRGERIIDVR
jgi:hypothetical protein